MDQVIPTTGCVWVLQIMDGTSVFFPWFQHKKYKKPSMFGQNGVPPMTEEEKRIQKDLKLKKGSNVLEANTNQYHG